MGIMQNLSALALCQVVEGALRTVGIGSGGEAVVNFLTERFTDQSQRLTAALQSANERAWKAFEVALAGESLWDRCKGALARGEDQAFREQVRAFLNVSPLTRASVEHAQLFRAALQELRAARSRRLLTGGALAPDQLAREVGTFARFSDPHALIDAEWKVVERTAGELREACPKLYTILVARTASGAKPSLLVVAVRYYFRRELESDPELFRGLAIAKLDALQEAQEKGFAGLTEALSRQGDRLEQMLADLSGTVIEIAKTTKEIAKTTKDTHDRVQALEGQIQKLVEQLQLQNREVRPSDSLSMRNDAERQLVKRLVAQYRSLPEENRRQLPGLLSNLGKLEVAAGDFGEAQQNFQTVATMVSDPKVKAEAHHNAYQAALERQAWDEALAALRQAVALDAARFTLFPFAKYEPKRILGAGGFGVVFLCQHTHVIKPVVVKSLAASELDRDVAAVFAEAQALADLQHPAIIRLWDCDYADAARSRPYLVMDFFDGASLDAYVKEQGLLSPEELLSVAIPAAEALQAAHASGIMHRDVKPANLLVRRDGDRLHVKLIDFGLALRPTTLAGQVSSSGPQAHTTVGKSIAGTLHYAAPEQMGQLEGGQVGPHSDVYGFGKTCYFALLGTSDPDDVEKEELPEPWRKFLSRCTGRKLAHRLADFTAVLAELDALKAAMATLKAQPAERVLEPRPTPKERPQAGDRKSSKPRLFIRAKGIVAQGQETEDGLLVFAGSQAVKEAVPSIQEYMLELRNALVQQGVLVGGPDCLTLARDYAFDSPSMAAGVVLGRNANGRLDWKDKEGRTLKLLQQLEADAEAPVAKPVGQAVRQGVDAGRGPPADPNRLTTHDGLMDYLHSKQAEHGMTPLVLEKVKFLNPDGIKSGVFYMVSGGGVGDKKMLPKLQALLPPGTLIKVKWVSEKDLEEAKAVGFFSAGKTAAETEPAPAAGRGWDRGYWESKGSKKTLLATDNLLNLVHQVEPKATLKYTKYYIGLDVDGSPRNFVTFRPRKSYVVMAFNLPESKEVDDQLKEAGLDPLPYDNARGCRVRVGAAVDDKQRTVLLRLIRQASEGFGK